MYEDNPFHHVPPIGPDLRTPFNRVPVFSTMGRGPRGEQGERGFPGEASRKDFETVADMTAEQSLEAGDICRTLGFHAAGDGGAAWYQVVDDAAANGMDIIALDNGLYAVLNYDSELSIVQLGAKRDDVNAGDDNDNVFARVSTLVETSNKYLGNADVLNVFVPKGSFYVNSEIIFKGNVFLYGSGKIVANAAMDNVISFDADSTLGDVNISGIKIDGNLLAESGLNVSKCVSFLSNLFVTRCTVSNIVITSGSMKATRCKVVQNIDSNGNPSNNLLTDNAYAFDISANDCELDHCVTINFKNHYKVNGAPTYFNTCHSWNSAPYGNDSVMIDSKRFGFIFITDCECDTIETFIKFSKSSTIVRVLNSIFFIAANSNIDSPLIFDFNSYSPSLYVDQFCIQTNGYSIVVDNYSGDYRGRPIYNNCYSDSLTSAGTDENFGKLYPNISWDNFSPYNSTVLVETVGGFTFVSFSGDISTPEDMSSAKQIAHLSNSRAVYPQIQFPVRLTFTGPVFEMGVGTLNSDGTITIRASSDNTTPIGANVTFMFPA